jgi:hypothetical protein
MPLQLQTADVSDARTLTSVVFQAFLPNDPFESMIYPFGPTPKAMEHEYQGIMKNFEDPNVQYIKVVDTEIRELNRPIYKAIELIYQAPKDGSEIIAFARWKIWKEERPKEVWDALWGPGKIDLMNAVDGILNDVDVVVEQEFYKNGQTMRRKHIQGDPCICKSTFIINQTFLL